MSVPRGTILGEVGRNGMSSDFVGSALIRASSVCGKFGAVVHKAYVWHMPRPMPIFGMGMRSRTKPGS